MAASLALGIDIGGTFTDIVAFDSESGCVVKTKVLTTPGDPAQGVIRGLRKLLSENGLAAGSFARTVHATTLFSNALIERKGAPTGLITTEGFRDALEIGRERKYELYDVFIAKPAPLVPRNLRLEVPERIGADGEVLLPLDEAALDARVEELLAAGVTSIAIVFLHAYANPVHEDRALAAIAERHPGLFLSASHDVSPEIREYERCSTTVANAYVKPLAASYLDRLVEETAGLGISAPFFMMLSNGGLTHLDEAKRTPVRLLESGPAAGALVAARFGRLAGEENVLAFDMGGTTAKLALVEDGEPHVTYAFEAAREKRFMEGSGLPIGISTIELIEIGAGGGSIARLDRMGLLKVGPDSAGSEPGPACYGRGGTAPTVTDADLVLGYLDPGAFAGGAMTIDCDAAMAALRPLARDLGMDVIEVAAGIHDVVNESMASAARIHVAERGKDPRRFTLLATGGAGPVHAYGVARKLGLRRIVVPRAAGVASALGLLVAPARVDRVATVARRFAEIDWPRLEAAYRALEAEAARVIAETGLDPVEAEVVRLADMRFAGQGFELVVELPAGPYDEAAAPALARAFATSYRAAFARTPPEVEPEIVNIRVSVRASIPGVSALAQAPAAVSREKPRHRRKIYFREAGGFVEAWVCSRASLAPGARVRGPAVVEESESTLVVGPGGVVTVDAAGNLVVDLREERPS